MENENQEFLNTQFPGKDGSDIHKPTEAQEQEELAYILQTAAPSSTPQSVEGITKEKVLETISHNYRKYLDRDYGSMYEVMIRGTECLAAMEQYGNQMFEAGKMMEKVVAETAIKKLGDKEREIEQNDVALKNLDWEVSCLKKEVEYLKARCEAAETYINLINSDCSSEEEIEAQENWQALKNKKPE